MKICQLKWPILQPTWLQSLYTVKLVHIRHVITADTFSWNKPNHVQTLIEKALYSGKFCSGQLLQRTRFFGTTRLAQAKVIRFSFFIPSFSFTGLLNFRKDLLRQGVTLESP